MRNYKTNFAEVDEILFVPKHDKRGEKNKNKRFNATVEALYHVPWISHAIWYAHFSPLIRCFVSQFPVYVHQRINALDVRAFVAFSMCLKCFCLFWNLAHTVFVIYWFVSEHLSSLFLCHQSGIEHFQHSFISMQTRKKSALCSAQCAHTFLWVMPFVYENCKLE